MTFKSLERKGFSVYKREEDNKCFLYQKDEEGYGKFYAEFKKIDDITFQFQKNEPTKDVRILLNQIAEHNSKLFRPAVYYDTHRRLGYADRDLLYHELTKAGFARPKDNYNTGVSSITHCFGTTIEHWQLKTQVFGSEFTFQVDVSYDHRKDSRMFTVNYVLIDGGFSPPLYRVDCYGAESVLYMVSKMKTYVLEQTIKQLVALYEKEIVYDKKAVKIKNEGVFAIDSKFRLWVDAKTWEDLEKQNGKYDYTQMKPVAYFKKNQDFMVCADLYFEPDNTGLVAL